LWKKSGISIRLSSISLPLLHLKIWNFEQISVGFTTGSPVIWPKPDPSPRKIRFFTHNWSFVDTSRTKFLERHNQKLCSPVYLSSIFLLYCPFLKLHNFLGCKMWKFYTSPKRVSFFFFFFVPKISVQKCEGNVFFQTNIILNRTIRKWNE
jgi:hypothetical protein